MKKTLILILSIFFASTFFNLIAAQAVVSNSFDLNACITAINDPLYTRDTLATTMRNPNGTQLYANGDALQAAISANSINLYVANGPGLILDGGGDRQNNPDLYCGDSYDNSVNNLDSNTSSRDHFFGGAGNDSVTNSWLSDFYGGPGDDYVGQLSENSYFNGGPGADLVGSNSSSTFVQGQDDSTPPTVSSVSSNTATGTYKADTLIDIRISFSEAVIVTGTPQITLETGSIDRAVNYSSGSASSVLVFNYLVQAGDTSGDLDYLATNSLALNGGTIKDAAGNNATLTLATPGAAGSLRANKSIVIDTTAPTISSASLNSTGTAITLTYDQTLSATTAPTSAFAVLDSGTAVTVSSATASGSVVTLALGTTINVGKLVSVTYTDPAGDDVSAIQDLIGNDAASFSSQSVTNNSIVKATPTFSSWSNVTKNFGNANYTVTAPSTAGFPAGQLSYSSSNASVISISGSTFTVAGGGTSTITATFTPTDTSSYNAATTTNTVTVDKASQTPITITSTSAIFGTDLTLTSTGGSTGGTFTYSKVSGDCTISGETLTPTASGSCIIYSSLATTTDYLAAQSANTTITIATSNVSASITLDAGTLIYRQVKVITATASVAGKVTFKVNGKKLPGCIKKRVLAPNSYIATCSYKPSTRGYIRISTTLNPTNNSYIGTTTTSEWLFVGNRSGTR